MTEREGSTTRIGIEFLALLFLLFPVSVLGFTIPGDPGDGEIRYDNGSVNVSSEEISIGHRGASGDELATAIYFFELPDLSSSADVGTAVLQFSLNDRSGSFATNPANADIWGLGYVASPTINTNWHLLGDSDTRTGDDLGTGIGANPVVRLANDYLTKHSNDPKDEPYRMALPSKSLAEFIGMLYDEGAVAGDYAVIRVAIDQPTSLGNRGFDLASADAADEATRPVLSINANTPLVFDPFTDGGRSEGADALDTDWFFISGDLNFSVQDDATGIGEGNALHTEMLIGGRRFLGGFSPVTLSEPGDFIQLSCTFRPTFVFFVNEYFQEAFRMGLLTSGGSPLISDTTSASSVTNYSGYVARMSAIPSPDSAISLSTYGLTAPTSFLGGDNADFLAKESDALSVEAPNVYSLVYTVTRANSTQMTTRVEVNDVVLNGMDPGTDTPTNDYVYAIVDTFDTIGMGSGNTRQGIDFFVDNVFVQSSVPILPIVPHEVVATDAVELRIQTQPDIRYALQEATDPVSSNWTDSGYVLTGDGGNLGVFDPSAAEPAKSYRLESRP